MLKMSFYDGTLDSAELIEFIKATSKPIKYTYGLIYKNPVTLRKPITLEEALVIIRTQSFLDADEYDDYVHLHAFSSNDLWQ